MTARSAGLRAGVLSVLVLLAFAACSSSPTHAWPSEPTGDGGGDVEGDAAAPSEPGHDGGADASDEAPPPPYDFSVKCAGDPCAVRLAARGGSHACVALRDGTAWCWGANASGQLGTGWNDAGAISAYEPRPHRVAGVTSAKSVAATGTGTEGTTCVVHGTGEVACFGSNASGQLGRGTAASTRPNPEPAPVEGGLQAKSVVLTNRIALAIGTDERLWSWGTNELRLLARSTTGPEDAPANVAALVDAVSVAPRSCGGTSYAAFVVAADGSLLSWGGGLYDQLGRPSSLYQDPGPDRIALSGVSSVATGANHACALVRGQVHCWGWNEHGELGTGRKAEELLPARVLLPPGVHAVAVAAGGDNTCIIAANGDVHCWGANGSKQLGASQLVVSAMPLKIDGLGEEAVDVAVMDEAICALLRSGSVKCWGENFLGQLGRGTRELESSAVPGLVAFE